MSAHFCRVFNRLVTPGKQRKHLRRCATCKEMVKAEWARRLAKRDDAAIRDVAPPAPDEQVDTMPVIEAL